MELSHSLLQNLNLIDSEDNQLITDSLILNISFVGNEQQQDLIKLITQNNEEIFTLEQLDYFLKENENYNVFNDFLKLLTPDACSDIFYTIIGQDTNPEDNESVHQYIQQISAVYSQIFEKEYADKILSLISQICLNFINTDFYTIN